MGGRPWSARSSTDRIFARTWVHHTRLRIIDDEATRGRRYGAARNGRNGGTVTATCGGDTPWPRGGGGIKRGSNMFRRHALLPRWSTICKVWAGLLSAHSFGARRANIALQSCAAMSIAATKVAQCAELKSAIHGPTRRSGECNGWVGASGSEVILVAAAKRNQPSHSFEAKGNSGCNTGFG